MLQAISATFHFPSMRRDVFDYARSCQKGQRFESPTTKTGLLSPHALTHVQSFQCLLMDVQHVKRSAINGFKFNLVLSFHNVFFPDKCHPWCHLSVDPATRWNESRHLATKA